MFEMCEGHVSLNTKHYVSFKSSLDCLKYVKIPEPRLTTHEATWNHNQSHNTFMIILLRTC